MAISPPTRIDGVVVHEADGFFRDPLLRRGVVAALLAAACGLWAASRDLTAPGAQALLTCASGVMALAAALLVRRARQRTVANLELGDDGLTLDVGGARSEIPWSSVARWTTSASRDGEVDVLRLECDDGRAWELVAPNEEAHLAAVSAVRDALGRRALTVPLQGRLDASGWTALVVLLSVAAPMPLADAVMRAGGAFAGVLAWAAGFAVAARLVREVCVSRVTVGGDGVSLQRMGCERFVSWAMVEEVDWDEFGVLLRLRDGEELALPLLSESMVRAERDGSVARAVRLRDALHERLRAELDAWRGRRSAPDDVEALLDRRGRSLEDWRASVRALIGHVPGYRAVRIDPRVAARVLDDPTAPLERRVAAVWALRDHDPPRATTRIRVALESAACEPVREVLGLAAHDDLDELTLDRALDTAERG